MKAMILTKGLANVELNNKWGFINKKGEVVIPFIYDDTDRFRDGEAQVIKDDETFFDKYERRTSGN